MTIGIYRILNLVTGKCYVGKSENIEDRWYGKNGHWLMLQNRNHQAKLQNAWNKYGEEAFKFEILEECPKEKLAWLEAFWMTKLDAVDNGYNILRVTLEDGLVVIRNPISEETRRKLSKAALGRSVSAETRIKISKCHLGKEVSAETRQKLSNIQKRVIRKPLTTETKQKISLANKGKKRSEDFCLRLAKIALERTPISEETKQKMSQANKGQGLGRKLSEETKQKIRDSKKNISDETRQKISDSSKGRGLGSKRSEETKKRMREAWERRRAHV